MAFPKSEIPAKNQCGFDQIQSQKKSPKFLIDASGFGDKNPRRRCFSVDEFSLN